MISWTCDIFIPGCALQAWMVNMKKISNTNYRVNVNSKASGYDTRETAFERAKGGG
jgi:hypothetical protein